MSRQQKVATWIAILVGLASLVGALSGAKAWADSAYVTTKRYSVDSLQRTQDRAALDTLGVRVRDIYCATVPPQKRQGCR
jgi:hypothetical protein